MKFTFSYLRATEEEELLRTMQLSSYTPLCRSRSFFEINQRIIEGFGVLRRDEIVETADIMKSRLCQFQEAMKCLNYYLIICKFW